MVNELSTSTVEARGFSQLERELYQELPETVDTKETKSFVRKVGNGLNWLQEQYFKPKFFEKSGKLYENLGVKTFKKFLPTMGGYMCRLTGYRWINGKKDLGMRDFWTRVYETIHLTIGSVVTVQTIDKIADGDYDGAAIQTALNLLVNVYPIMMQRYNRSRIYRTQERRKDACPTK